MRRKKAEERDASKDSLQEPPNRLRHLLQQDSWRIDDSETSNGRNILGDDVLGVGSWMKKSFDVAVSARKGGNEVQQSEKEGGDG